MKKIISILLVIQIFYLFSGTAFANVSEIPSSVKIVKENQKYCLKDKKTGDILIPCEYDKMKRLGKTAVKVLKNGKYGIIYNNNETAIPPEYDVVKAKKIKQKGKKYTNYYGIDKKTNTVISKVETKAWPYDKAGDIRAHLIEEEIKNGYPAEDYIIAVTKKEKNKELKYGFVKELGNNTYISIPAEYDGYFFPDRKSVISQKYDISYFTDAIIVKKDGKWGIIDKKGQMLVDFIYDKIITFDAVVDEDVINNRYKKIDFPVKDKFIGFLGERIYIIDLNGNIIHHAQKPKINIKNDKGQVYSLSAIYKMYNQNALVKLENFPVSGIILYEENGKYGFYVMDGEKSQYYTIKPKYDLIRFPDDNSVVFNLLNISFAPFNQVWVRETKYYNKGQKNESFSTVEKVYSDINDLSKWVSKRNSSERIKPAITFENNVKFERNYIRIINKKTSSQNINYENYDKTVSRDILGKNADNMLYPQKMALTDVAINQDLETVPPYQSYKKNPYAVENALGWTAVVILAPLEIIAFPFLVLAIYWAHKN